MNLYYLSCSIVLFSIGFLSLLLTYIIIALIGIYDISSNSNLQKCNDSHLIIYSFITLILLVKINNTIICLTKDKNEIYIYIIEIISTIIMCIWGIYEFFGVDCINNLTDTILYKSCFAYWIFNNILLTLILLSSIYKFITYKNNDNCINDFDNI